jgi:hypothetical protein
MIFGKRKKKDINYIPDIKIDSQTLEIVDETKFLGVILDSGLNWKRHINYTSTKIAKAIGILSKTKQFLNRKTLVLFCLSPPKLWKSHLGQCRSNFIMADFSSYKN